MIPNGVTTLTIQDTVTSISNYAFDGCRKLESIYVSEHNNTYSSLNGILYNKAQTKIIKIPDAIPEELIPNNLAILETPHSYYNGMNTTYSKTIEGSESLSLIFDKDCYLEDSCDYIRIYDKYDRLIYDSCGKGCAALANKEFIVPGDTVKIVFHTDGSVVYWGFRCIVQKNDT